MGEIHKHSWNFIRTFIAEGKPKTMKRIIPTFVDSTNPTKVQMWIDARQEYALYHCVCGEKKQVEL
jgi:hypothetical protein